MIPFGFKMRFQTFLTVKICLFICVQCHIGESGSGNFHLSSFDFTEVESIHYDVNIEGVPVLDQALALEEKHGIPMTNKFGQKYFCTLPKTTLADADQDTDVDGKPTSPSKKSVDEPTKIPELLSPMAREPCLVTTKDWWTYEVCYQKVAKQYHVEDGRPSGAIMVLGYYDHDLEWPESNPGESEDEMQATLRHHKQFYTNGSKCDLTGDFRKTEVRYECDPLSVVDYISRVDEPQSCEYVIVVKTTKICSIPQLKPPPTKKPKPIDCAPILNEQEFQKYEKYKIAKEVYAQKKAKENTLFQRNQMLKLLDGEDLTGIDINTDEGLAIVESRVGERMADKLVSELGLLFDSSKDNKIIGGRRRAFASLEDLFKPQPTKSDVIEEVILQNGQKQSRLKNIRNSNWDSLSSLNKKAKSFANTETKAPTVDKLKTGKLDSVKMDSSEKVDSQNMDSVNLDPRSDLSDEDEMLDVLIQTFRKMTGDEENLKSLKEELKSIRETVGESLDEILEETEREMNLKLDGFDRHQAIDQLSHTLNELMSKLDETEADIARMTSQIEKAQEVIDDAEQGAFQKTNNKDRKNKEKSPTKNDKSSKAKEAISSKKGEKVAKVDDIVFDKKNDKDKTSTEKDEKEEKPEQSQVSVKMTNLSPNLGGLQESSLSEERVIKHLESAIKEKLEHSGLDTGGRQIEVKLITASSYPAEISQGLDSESDEEGGEARQIQQMIYNLMIGDQVGYTDIDTQRKSERNYKFTFDQNDLTLDLGSLDDDSNSKNEKVSEESSQQSEDSVQGEKDRN